MIPAAGACQNFIVKLGQHNFLVPRAVKAMTDVLMLTYGQDFPVRIARFVTVNYEASTQSGFTTHIFSTITGVPNPAIRFPTATTTSWLTAMLSSARRSFGNFHLLMRK